MKLRSRRWTVAFCLLGSTCALAVAWDWWSAAREQLVLEQVRSEMDSGHFAVAARKLADLVSRNPGSGELAYLLGTCEQRRGRHEAANEAWARVAPDSEFSPKAIEARMSLAANSGQLAEAERLVEEAANDPRSDGPALRAMLVPIYSQLGRLDEAKRLVEARWEQLNSIDEGASERAIFQLQRHLVLTLKPNSAANVRSYLDHLSSLAPKDDRVWLGRANLAIRTGDYAEAQKWLDSCLERRPDDVPVWRARLNWGLAVNRIDIVKEAMRHLPVDESTPAQIHRLSAWLSAQKGDAASERQELERLIAIEPGDLAVLDRLASFAQKDGQSARAAELERKKSDIERLRARYERLYDRRQPIRDAVEIAQLAEHLGRIFEARAYLMLALSEDPELEGPRRDLARLSQLSPPAADGRRTLAEALAVRLFNDPNHAITPAGSAALGPM